MNFRILMARTQQLHKIQPFAKGTHIHIAKALSTPFPDHPFDPDNGARFQPI
jgi:hypothetical protein